MSFFFRKNLSTTFSFLHRIQLSNFGRNVKAGPFQVPGMTNKKFDASQTKSIQKEKEAIVDFKEKPQKKDYFEDMDQEPLSDTKILQLEILRTQTLASVLDVFRGNKAKMDIVNVCTCFNRAVSFGTKSGQSKDSLVNVAEIKQMIQFLKNNINKMNDFSIANFLSNLAKLELLDRELIDQVVQKTIQNNIQYNEKSLAFITWALAKLKIRNEAFLELVAKRILNPEAQFKAKSLSFIFWAMSELSYRNNQVIEMMNQFVIDFNERFDHIDLHLVFSAYSNYRLTNWDVLDKLSQHIVKKAQDLSFRTLANITNFCANLNYVNHTLFDHLEREFVRRLKKTPEFQKILNDSGDEFGLFASGEEQQKIQNEKENEAELEKKIKPSSKEEELYKKNQQKNETQDLNESLNLIDVTQILVSFCKLKVIKSELFELLELHFIKNLDKASAGSMVSYAFAHSALCNEMYQKYQENKKTFMKRSVKNLKKYNHTFYEVMIPFMQLKSPEFTADETYSILVSASRPLLSKRILRRGVVEFGVMNIPKLEGLKNTLSTLEFEKFIYKYNLMLQKFVDKKEQLIMISQGFAEININIGLIDKVYNQVLLDENRPKASWAEKDETFFEEDEEEIEIDDVTEEKAEKEAN